MSFLNFNVMGVNVNLFTLAIGVIIGGIIACHTVFGCSLFYKNNSGKEGFITGAPIGWRMGEGVPGNKWSRPPVANAAQAHQNMYAPLANHTGGPVPPTGLFMWADNKFLPECCLTPQQYSSSTGCACISKEQMQFLSGRGGNNTLP